MAIALIMMQKDEDQLLWPWLRYHGSRFGYENCYLFDNGSTNCLVRAQLARAEELGATVVYDRDRRADFNKKHEIIQGKIEELRQLQSYQAFVPMDCDEFLAILNGKNISLSGHRVRKYIAEVGKDGDYYLRVSARYMNSPVERDRFYRTRLQKVIFLPGSRSGQVDIGFHMGRLKESNVIPTKLAYIEFHNRPYQDTLRSAREKLWLRVPDFSHDTLKNYKGPGHHLTKYFLMDEEEYLQRTHGAKKLVKIGMSAEFRRLGAKYPFLDGIG